MRDLRDWYSYLERSIQTTRPPSDSRTQTHPADLGAPPTPVHSAPALRPPAKRVQEARLRRPGKKAVPLELQQPLPINLGPRQAVRRGGRPPLTETREQIIRRLLDPELTLHEAAAVLDLSKATLRRYTDHGKLPCRRTAGGQRRFQLSAVLALLEQQEEAT